MLKIPRLLKKKYERLLIRSDILPSEYSACRKWLRFYLNFCQKYRYGYSEPESFFLFIDKLKTKKK